MSSPRCVTRRKGRTVLNPRRIRKIRRRRRRRRAAAASADPSNRRRRHHCWGSTRVFSPLFCVEREERKRVRYQITNTFFIETCCCVSCLSFLRRDDEDVSLFQDVAEIQVFGAPPHKTKKATQNYKNDRRKKFVRSKRKGEWKF